MRVVRREGGLHGRGILPYLVCCVLTGWLLFSASAAFGDDVDLPGWEQIRWGMTEGEVQGVLKDRVVIRPSPERYSGRYSPMKARAMIGEHRLDGDLQFSDQNRRLVSILMRPEVADKTVADALLARLTERYGQPGAMPDGPRGEAKVWRRGSTTVVFDHLDVKVLDRQILRKTIVHYHSTEAFDALLALLRDREVAPGIGRPGEVHPGLREGGNCFLKAASRVALTPQHAVEARNAAVLNDADNLKALEAGGYVISLPTPTRGRILRMRLILVGVPKTEEERGLAGAWRVVDWGDGVKAAPDIVLEGLKLGYAPVPAFVVHLRLLDGPHIGREVSVGGRYCSMEG